jgi:hypothetical protein
MQGVLVYMMPDTLEQMEEYDDIAMVEENNSMIE